LAAKTKIPSDLERAVPRAPASRACANGALKHYEKSVADYTEVIRLRADFTDAYNGRGQVYNAMKQYGKAIADLSEAIQLKSDLAEAYYNRAAAYEALGQDDKASNDYIAVIRLKKSDQLPKAAP
jgi:tetratricopeptide (TPR) repeat protein